MMKLNRWLLIIFAFVSINVIDFILVAAGLGVATSLEMNLLIAFICAWCVKGDDNG